MNKTAIEHLFQSARMISDKSDQLKRAKGETFNVFSILRMENKENDTHSNFIGNLLDQNGSHLMGSVFLELFLKSLELEDWLEVNSTRVHLEFWCGKIDNTSKTGGRIDIYLVDEYDKSISIENKIYAGDQYQQIERYVSFNRPRNKVFYLTLNGDDASEKSRGELNSGKDYSLISYKDTIVNWLGLCIKEAASEPIVRETIRQYQILLKQLTNTMEGKSQIELQELILNNFRAAELVARNFDRAKEMLCGRFRSAVVHSLNEKLEGTIYRAREGAKISTSYAQVWVWNIENNDALVYFGIEPFGTKANDPIFHGIFTYGDVGFEEMEEVKRYNQYWSNLDYVSNFEGIQLHMSNVAFIERLFSSNDFFTGAVEHLCSSFMSFFEENRELVEDYLSKSKVK